MCLYLCSYTVETLPKLMSPPWRDGLLWALTLGAASTSILAQILKTQQSFERLVWCVFSYIADTSPKTDDSAMKKGFTLGADSSSNLHFHLGPDL